MVGVKNFYVKAMGCRLNQAEGAFIIGALENLLKLHRVEKETDEVDVMVLHTCAITAQAQREVMRSVRSYKRRGIKYIIVSGCASSIDFSEELKDAGASAVVCNKLNDIRIYTDDVGASELSDVVMLSLTGDPVVHGFSPKVTTSRAAVKIQDGCNFRCSYCIVPDARGVPVSRAYDEIMNEVRYHLSKGFSEIVLTGVNIVCWNNSGKRIEDLVRDITKENGLGRVRLGSVEPRTSEHKLIDLMKDSEGKVCKTLHYPMQSGSTKILNLMRRHYNAEEFSNVVEYALEKMPRLGLGTDIITGFPGETEEDFLETYKMVEKYPFSNLHVFPYSERPGTPAVDLPNKVPMHERRNRAKRLIELGEKKRSAFVNSFENEIVEVLIERIDNEGCGRGWTSEYVEARVRNCTLDNVGHLIHAKATGIRDNKLICSL